MIFESFKFFFWVNLANLVYFTGKALYKFIDWNYALMKFVAKKARASMVKLERRVNGVSGV